MSRGPLSTQGGNHGSSVRHFHRNVHRTHQVGGFSQKAGVANNETDSEAMSGSGRFLFGKSQEEKSKISFPAIWSSVQKVFPNQETKG